MLISNLKNPESHTLDKRIALWAIGNIGRTKKGVELLKKEKLFKELVNLAENADYLSLRGTCYYVLNFLCTTSDGRR